MDLTVLAPAYNEERSLRLLYGRVAAVLDRLGASGRASEFVVVDDGSTDATSRILAELAAEDGRVVPVTLARNGGQYRALVRGFRAARGNAVVTLDADLQNPPEEIPRLLDALDAGHDLVTTYRVRRRDSFFRRHASRASNRLSSWIAGFSIRDHGCMLCGYRRALVDAMSCGFERMQFITALALRYAESPVSIEVQHEPRVHGTSRYHVFRLARLQLDAALSFRRMRLERERDPTCTPLRSARSPAAARVGRSS